MYIEKAFVEVDLSVNKKAFKYLVHESLDCPVCNKRTTEVSWWEKSRRPNGSSKLCHPLKRIPVCGMLWWKKFCPIDKVHYHTSCNKCKVDWIRTAKKEQQYNPVFEEKNFKGKYE